MVITRAHQFYGPRVTNTPAAPGPRRSAPWLLYLAMGLFLVGVLAVIAIFLTALITGSAPGLWVYLIAMLAPVGFLLGVIYALWSGRRSR